jgi:hypothetical protein
MAGLDPATQGMFHKPLGIAVEMLKQRSWVAGSSPAMTNIFW